MWPGQGWGTDVRVRGWRGRFSRCCRARRPAVLLQDRGQHDEGGSPSRMCGPLGAAAKAGPARPTGHGRAASTTSSPTLGASRSRCRRPAEAATTSLRRRRCWRRFRPWPASSAAPDVGRTCSSPTAATTTARTAAWCGSAGSDELAALRGVRTELPGRCATFPGRCATEWFARVRSAPGRRAVRPGGGGCGKHPVRAVGTGIRHTVRSVPHEG